MTLIDQSRVGRGRYAVRLNVANLFNWWRGRWRQRQDRKSLAELPSDLLRDVGLEHLIDLNPDSKFNSRW